MSYTRNCLCQCIVIMIVLASIANPIAQAGSGKKSAPNVIIVITDDQGYGDVGVHGNEVIKTPNLDRLYRQSIRLTNFHVDPTCAPTRSALMTGRYSGRVGVWHTIMGRSMLRGGEVTIAELLKSVGYITGIFGKWHLGDNFPSRPQDHGFDEVFVHGGGGVGQTPDYFGNDYFNDTYWHNGTPKKMTGYCTDVWFDAAMNFIAANKHRPFFAYITTNAPHGPYNVPERYRQMYVGNKKVVNPNFYGMITNIDDNMGRLMKQLDDLKIADNTILIFTTDNGTAAGFNGNNGFNAGMRGTKGSPYDGGHRVPCFIRWPAGGLGGGKDIPNLTVHMDLAPTLLELCAVQPQKKPKFDGKSLVPLLRGKGKDWTPRTLIVESQRIETPEKWRQSAVMTDRYRLINGKELYDMQADPGQKKNIAADHPEVVEKLRAAYEKWWADVSKTHDQYAWIILGAPEENPSRLTCHDWHSKAPPWSQVHIQRGAVANGFWAVDVGRKGTYEITLRRWPEEAADPINKGKGPKATKAKVKIFDKTVSQPVAENAEKVTFRMDLPTGRTQLQTWFDNEQGQSRGAYFVYVRRLTD